MVPVLAAIGLACAVAAFAGLPLAWDGSSYLFETLDHQTFFAPHGRFINWMLQLPVLAVSQFTDATPALVVTFSLSYAAVPVAALVAAWLVVKDTCPALMVWPILSVGLATLPGQALFVSEALFVTQLLWAPLLAVLTRAPLHRLPGPVFAGLLTISHPFGLPVLAGLALTAAVMRHWRWAALAVALTAVAATRLALTHTSFESSSLSVDFARGQFDRAVAGIPLLIVGCAAALGLLLRPLERFGDARAPVWNALIAAPLLVAAGAGIAWAVDTSTWRNALDYRTWALAAAAPFAGLAVIDAVSRSRRRASWVHMRVSAGVAAVFLAVVVTQSVAWATLRASVAREASERSGPCVDLASVRSAHGTPLEFWALPAYSLLVQGRTPQHVILADCDGWTDPSRLPLYPWADRHMDSGWFDLSALRDEHSGP